MPHSAPAVPSWSTGNTGRGSRPPPCCWATAEVERRGERCSGVPLELRIPLGLDVAAATCRTLSPVAVLRSQVELMNHKGLPTTYYGSSIITSRRVAPHRKPQRVPLAPPLVTEPPHGPYITAFSRSLAHVALRIGMTKGAAGLPEHLAGDVAVLQLRLVSRDRSPSSCCPLAMVTFLGLFDPASPRAPVWRALSVEACHFGPPVEA